MPQKHLKKFGKNAMILTGTGIGLSVGSSLLSDAGGDASALSPLSKGVGTLGGLAVAGAAIGVLGDIDKDIKKKMRRR